MVSVVVDSSLLIEKIRRGSENFDNLIKLQRIGKIGISIPVVVIAELWAGDSMNIKKQVDIIETMISHMKRIEVNEKIAKISGEMVRKYKVGTMDALIAASALEDNAEVATLNTKHFKKIKGLKLFNE